MPAGTTFVGADHLGSWGALGSVSGCRDRSCTLHTSHSRIMPPKKPAGNVVQAEVALQQSLKNCLVNLPASLVSVLVNANAVSCRPPLTAHNTDTSDVGRAECRRRALLPSAAPARRLGCTQCIPAEVDIRGMDGHAEQAQACGRGRQEWAEEQPSSQSARRCRSRGGCDLRQADRAERGPQSGHTTAPGSPTSAYHQHRALDSGRLGDDRASRSVS